MDWNVIIVALMTLGTPILLYFQNRSNNKRLQKNDENVNALEQVKTDAAAMDRAKAIYEGVISTLETQVTKLRETVNHLEDDIEEGREDAERLRLRIRELENLIDNLEDELREAKLQIARLNAELAKFKLDYPTN